MRTYKRFKIEGACYFFTVVTHERNKLFASAEAVAMLEAAIAEVQRRHPFDLEAQVVLPDHLHSLWQLPDGDADYSMRWRLIKDRFTRAWVRLHGSTAPTASRIAKGEQAVWQRRYWEHMIRDERDFDEHLDYIHYNPVHHGIVAAPRNWPHSTFGKWVERGVYEQYWGADEMPPLPDWAKRAE